MKLHYVTFAIVLSGGSTASSMTDIENFGKFLNLKGTPTIGRKMSSLKVREGKKEVEEVNLLIGLACYGLEYFLIAMLVVRCCTI